MAKLVQDTMAQENVLKGALVQPLKIGENLDVALKKDSFVSPFATMIFNCSYQIAEEEKRCLVPICLVNKDNLKEESKISCLITDEKSIVKGNNDSIELTFAKSGDKIYDSHPRDKDNVFYQKKEEIPYNDEYRCLLIGFENNYREVYFRRTITVPNASGVGWRNWASISKAVDGEVLWDFIPIPSDTSVDAVLANPTAYKIIGDYIYFVSETYIAQQIIIWKLNKHTGKVIDEVVIRLSSLISSGGASCIISSEYYLFYLGSGTYINELRFIDQNYNLHTFKLKRLGTEFFGFNLISCNQTYTVFVGHYTHPFLPTEIIQADCCICDTQSKSVVSQFLLNFSLPSGCTVHGLRISFHGENFYFAHIALTEGGHLGVTIIKDINLKIYNKTGSEVFSSIIHAPDYTSERIQDCLVFTREGWFLLNIITQTEYIFIKVNIPTGARSIFRLKKYRFLSSGDTSMLRVNLMHWEDEMLICHIDDTICTFDGNFNILANSKIPPNKEAVYVRQRKWVDKNKLGLILVCQETGNQYIHVIDRNIDSSFPVYSSYYIYMKYKELDIWNSTVEKEAYQFSYAQDNGEVIIGIPIADAFLEKKSLLFIMNTTASHKEFKLPSYCIPYKYACKTNGYFVCVAGNGQNTTQFFSGDNFTRITTSSKILSIKYSDIKEIKISTNKECVIMLMHSGSLHLYNFITKNFKTLTQRNVFSVQEGDGSMFLFSWANQKINVYELDYQGMVSQSYIIGNISNPYNHQVCIYNNIVYLYLVDAENQLGIIRKFSLDFKTDVEIYRFPLPQIAQLNGGAFNFSYDKKFSLSYSLQSESLCPYKILTGNFLSSDTMIMNKGDNISYFSKKGFILGKHLYLTKVLPNIKEEGKLMKADVYYMKDGKLVALDLNMVTG